MRRAIVLLLMLLLAGEGLAQDASSLGRQVGNQFISTYGNKQGINQKFAGPLTSSSRKMNPLLADFYRCPDTQKVYSSASECSSECSSPCQRGFHAQVTAPSSHAFLELVITPAGSGDISRTIVRQDLDFDGDFDYAYQTSLPISGVCANGFISCEPGTWSNCRYFRWAADNELRVYAEEVPHITTYLGGCYCINASCGQGSSLVWNNVGQILEHLGGGAVGAVQGKDPRLTVTAVDVDPTELYIRYYGQLTSELASRYAQSASEAPYLSGEQNPTFYYHAPAMLDLAVEDEARKQALAPESMYSMLTQSPAAKTQQFTLVNCTVRRNFDLENQVDVIGFIPEVLDVYDHSGDTEWCFLYDAVHSKCLYCYCCPDDISGTPGGPSQCGWKLSNQSNLLSITSQILYNSSSCISYTDPFTGQSGCWTPSGQPLAVQGLTWSRGYNPGRACCPDWPPDYAAKATWEAYFDNPEKCEAVRKQGRLIFCAWDRPVLLKTDTCAGADLTGCRLKDEQICQPDGSNCIWTVKDFAETKLKPLPDCIQRGSDTSGAIWTVCVDGRNMNYSSTSGKVGTLESGENIWWVVKRTYYCPKEKLYDLTSAKQRMASLQQTTAMSGSTLTWTDYLPAEGIYESGQAQIPGVGDWGDCEMVCEVRVGVPETQAASFGHQGHYLTSTVSIKDEYRPCELTDSGGWKCPYDPSKETMLHSCGCLNSFEEAVAGLQLLRDASKDIICSSTAPN